MTMQKTPTYGFPYPEKTDPVRDGAAAIEGIAKRLEKAMGDAQIPPGNPAQNDVVNRLNVLDRRVTALDGGAAFPFVQVDLISADMPNVGADTAVVWNARSGTAAMNTAAQPARLVAPIPGWYNVTTMVVFSNQSGGQRAISFQVFRAGVERRYRGGNNTAPSVSFYIELNGAIDLYLSAGDYIEIRVEANAPTAAIAIKADQGTRAHMKYSHP